MKKITLTPINNCDKSPLNLTLVLRTVCYTPLYVEWKGQILAGNFYRLYRNDYGGAGVIYNGAKMELIPGVFYLLPPRCELKVFCNNDVVKQLYVHFQLDHVDCSKKIIQLPTSEKLTQLADTLTDFSLAKNAGVTAEICALQLCIEAMALLPEGTLISRSRDYPIHSCCNYIRDHLSEELNVEQLARIAKLPIGEFRKRFQEACGCTPYAYLTELRYELAARLLEDSSLGIEEICTDVGIKDRFYFSREFKKKYGQPPAAYRKIFKVNAENQLPS